jgi:hypothetical protein
MVLFMVRKPHNITMIFKDELKSYQIRLLKIIIVEENY